MDYKIEWEGSFQLFSDSSNNHLLGTYYNNQDLIYYMPDVLYILSGPHKYPMRWLLLLFLFTEKKVGSEKLVHTGNKW